MYIEIIKIIFFFLCFQLERETIEKYVSSGALYNFNFDARDTRDGRK